MLSHRAVTYGIENFSLHGKSRWLLFYNPTFSAAQRTILATLSKGACLCLASKNKLATSLFETVQSMQIDALGLTPSALALLPPSECPPCLKQITTVGEPLGQKTVDEWAEKVDLRVSYGLSECAQLNFARQLRKGDNPRIAGHPMDTTQAFILEPAGLRHLPVEERGELCLAGPQVADGYHKRPEQTDASFVSNPYGENKLYRTGDLAVRHGDDSIEIVGRLDYQVKIHGQRLEPAEVAMALSKHPEVHALAVVTATIKGKTSLVAGIAAKESVGWSDLIEDLRMQAQVSLATYMIPNYWLQLKSIPINRNGKVDVIRIRQIAEEASVESLLGGAVDVEDRADEPKDSLELANRDAWAHVLDMKPSYIRRSSSFTALGGSSMDAIRVIRELRSRGLEAELSDILGARRLSDVRLSMIQKVDADVASHNPPRFALVADQKTQAQLRSEEGLVDAYPPTQLQASLLASTLQGNSDYLYQRTYDVRHLDLVKLRLCFHFVFSTSDILRTTYTSTDSGTLQIVRSDFKLPWKYVSMPLDAFRSEDKQKGVQFDLPFVRFTVLNKQLLVVSMHHSLFDFWSHHFLYEDVAKLYLGMDIVERPPFRRFIGHLQRQDWEPAKAFWNSYLERSEPSLLNTSPLNNAHEGSRQISLDVKAVTRTIGSTAGMLIYTAWALLIARHTGHSETTFATTIAGREIPLNDIDVLDGPTLTLVPQKIVLDPKLSFRNAIQRANASFWDVIKYSQYGMRRALSAASLQGGQLFDTLVNILVKNPGAETVSEKVFQPYGPRPNWQTEWTTLDVEENDDGFFLRLVSPMPKRRIAFVLDQMATIMTSIAENPDLPLETIDVLGENERRWLSTVNTIESVDSQRLHDRFEAIVQTHPDHIALQWQTQSFFTYGELDRFANKMSWYLLGQGLKPGDKIPLLLDKSPTMIITILALLKIGAAYVPLSPENSVERNIFIVQEIKAVMVLTVSNYCDYFPKETVASTLLDSLDLIDYPIHKPDIIVSPESLAYVIYTSGSTGQPKGVMIEHQSVSAAIGSIISFEGRANSHFKSLGFSDYVFDVSVYDIFGALSCGHTLCMAPTDRLLSDLANVINEMEVDHCFLTPTVARLLDPTSVPSLKVLTVGGESVTSDVVETWSSGHRLMNGYGPTETSILATMKDIKPDTNPRNIGRPLPTVKAFIIEANGHRLLPWGAVGELCFSGPQLGEGYLGRPEQTAVSFFEYDFEGISRIYRTGDLGRWLPSGDIECLGRKDNQIKINGYRVELGEVEQALLNAPCVKDAVVVVINSDVKSQLVGFVVLTTPKVDGHLPLQICLEETEVLRSSLKSLAHYMMPKYIIPLHGMPKLPSGKSNRKELMAIAGSMTAVELSKHALDSTNTSGPRITPESEMEKMLHAAWAKILGISGDQFGLEADFLNLGGDSIAAINLASHLRKNGHALSVGVALKFTNLKEMAEHVEKEKVRAVSEQKAFETPLEVQNKLEDRGLQNAVEYVYSCPPGQAEFVVQGAKDKQYWVLMTIRKLPEGTDVEAWLNLAERLAETNSILRTTFMQHQHTWYGIVLKDSRPNATWVEVSGDAQRREVVDSVWNSRFVFGQPFLSYTFMRHANGTHEVIVKMDHGLYDGTLLRVLDDHFRAIQHNQPIPPFTPFRDFADHLFSTQTSQAVQYWTSPTNRPTKFAYPKITNPTITATESLAVEDLKLDDFCKASGATPSTIFQAAFQLWLGFRTGSDDVSFDYLYTGRNVDLPNPQSINGTCANFLPLRSQIHNEQPMSEYLSTTQTAFWQATDNGVIPIQEIYDINGLAREQNANSALFLFQPFDPPPTQADKDEDMRWVVMAQSQVTMPQPYALVFEVVKLRVGWKFKLGYDTSCFDHGSAQAVAGEIEGLVREMMRCGEGGKVGAVMGSLAVEGLS